MTTPRPAPGGGSSSGSSPIDAAYTRLATAWVTEGPLLFLPNATQSADVFGGGLQTQNTTIDTSIAGAFGALSNSGIDPGASPAALAAGALLEYVCVFEASALPNVVGFASGVFLTESNPAAVATTSYSTSNTGVRRVGVGFTSAGVWNIYTCNGAALTVTPTGIAAVAGTKYKVKIILTVGTNVVVTIDANPSNTVVLTLPTIISGHGASKAATAANAISKAHGGFWRITAA